MTTMTMTIEPVSAFSSLDVLVAMDEGLFTAEGLDLGVEPGDESGTACRTWRSHDVPGVRVRQ